MFTVYKHTTPSNKVYIGITGRAPKARWNGGKGYICNKHFWNAIQKYGWENISHEIVASELTKEEACTLEIELISQYKSNNPDFGYNCSLGGEKSAYGCTHTVSEEARKKIGNANRLSLKGRRLSQECKHKISKSLKGRKHSDEHNKRVSEAMRGHTPTALARKHMSEAHRGKTLSLEQRNKISQSSKLFWSTLTEEQRSERSKKSISGRKNIVGVTLLKGGIAKTFTTSAECARYLGVSPALVCKKLKQSPSYIRDYEIFSNRG